MRTHVEAYCQIVDYNNNQLGRVYQDFQIQLTDLTVENLLEQFTLAKHTGLEKPGKFVQGSLCCLADDYCYGRNTLMCSDNVIISHFGFVGAVDFEEEKISIASVTGPPSDISDRSGNSLSGLNEQQRKMEGDAISVKSGNGSLQSGSGPLVSISGSASATGVLISTSTSPSPAIGTNINNVLESNISAGANNLNNSGSSDMKGI